MKGNEFKLITLKSILSNIVYYYREIKFN